MDIGRPPKPYSVIIPTFNNMALKRGSLPLVLRRLEPAGQFIEQVVIVDNASTEPLPNLTRSGLPIEILTCHSKNNRAAARNMGIAHSRAPFIVLLDDDTLVEAAALIQIASRLRDDTFWTCAERRFLPTSVSNAELTRAVRNGDDEWLQRSSFPYPGSNIPFSGWSRVLRFTFVACFGIVPSRELRRLGGFDERYEGWGCEDVDLMLRLMRGLKLESLFNCHVAYHIDHYVSPYQAAEQFRNRKRLDGLLVGDGSASNTISALSREILVGGFTSDSNLALNRPRPTILQRSALPRELESQVASALAAIDGEQVLEGAVLLQGPGRRNSIEIAAIVTEGDRRWVNVPNEAAIEIYIHVVPRMRLGRWLQLEAYDPGGWSQELSGWSNGCIIYDPFQTMEEVREHVTKWSALRTTRVLMQSIGELARLAESSDATCAQLQYRCRRLLEDLTCALSKNNFRPVEVAYNQMGAANNGPQQAFEEGLRMVGAVSPHAEGLKMLTALNPDQFRGAKILSEHYPGWILPIEGGVL